MTLNQYNKLGALSGSTLKIIAYLCMTIDHIGLILLPQYDILRIIGRLAFPIFAFFIAEGCRYSNHQLRRFLTILSIGILFFIFYYFYDNSVYGNIFLTFSVSIVLDRLLTFCKKYSFNNFKYYKLFIAILIFSSALIFTYHIFNLMIFEYRFTGMLLPVIINLFCFKEVDVPEKIAALDSHWMKMLLLILGSILLSLNGNLGQIQFFCLLSVPLLAFYNGKVGYKKLKYFFYFYYPAHLVIIEGIALMIYMFSNS